MYKILAVCAALFISACAQTQIQTPAAEKTPPAAVPVDAPRTVTVITTPPPTPTPPPKPPKPVYTAAQILGQSGAALRAKLGDPGFARADKPANIWQYKNANCVLNFFLYAAAQNNSGYPTSSAAAVSANVLHFDARDAAGNNMDRDDCLKTF